MPKSGGGLVSLGEVVDARRASGGRLDLLSYGDSVGSRKLPGGMWRGSVMLVQGCIAHLGIGVMFFGKFEGITQRRSEPG